MKFYSLFRKELFMIDGTIGLVSDWDDQSLGNTWITFSLERRFPGMEKVNMSNIENSLCSFLIFVGCINLDQKVIPKCPYIILSYWCDFETKYNADFIKGAVMFTARDVNSAGTFDFYPHVSSDLTFLYPQKLQRPNESIKYIKLVWRNLEEMKKKSIHYDLYIGNIPHIYDSLTMVRVRTLVEKFGLTTYDPQHIKYDEKVLYDKLRNVDLVISADYYSLIAAIQMGIPCIAINSCPSIKSMMNECSLREFCIDVKDILTLPDVIQKMNSSSVRRYVIEKMNNYSKQSTEKICEWMNLVENKIILSVKMLDKDIVEVDPLIVDKMVKDSQIGNHITDLLSKYSDAQKLEVIHNIKKDFDAFHLVTTENIKYRLEVAEIKNNEKKKEEEKQRVAKIEQQKLEEKKILNETHNEIVNNIFTSQYAPENNTVSRSVFIARQLKEHMERLNQS